MSAQVRRLVRSCSGLASALAALTALAAADSVDDGTKTLLDGDYAQRCAAALHPTDANRAKMNSFVSPEFVLLKPDGRPSDKGDLIDDSVTLSQKYRVTACSYNVKSFAQSDPDTIVATSDLQLRATLNVPGDHRVTARQQSQDTWVRSGQTWLLRLSALSRVLVKVDGNVLEDLSS